MLIWEVASTVLRSLRKGSWASSMRHHNGTFYASTFSYTTGKTHVYTTKDVEKGPWTAHEFAPALHDRSPTS